MSTEESNTRPVTSPRPTKATVGRGVAWSAAGAAGTQLLSFIAFLLIARALDPASFGLVALSALFVALLTVFVEQGFSQALVQRAALDPAHLDTAFWTNLGVSALLAVGLCLFAGTIGEQLDEAALPPVLRALSLSLILGALSAVHGAILQREMRFGALTSRPLIAGVFGSIVGIGMAWTGFGVWALVAQTLVGHTITTAGFWHATGWRPRLTYSVARLRELWFFGLNILGSNLVNFVNARAPEFFIGVELGKASLGLFSVASKIQNAMTQMLIGTITRVSMSTFSRFQHEPEMFRRVYFGAAQLTSAVTFPAFVGVAVLSTDIAHVVFGPQWLDVAPLIGIIALTGLPATIGRLTTVAINSLGHPKANLRLDVIMATFTFVGVVVCVRWGVEAIVLFLLIRSAAFAPIRFFILRRLVEARFRHLADAVAGSVVGAAIMAAALYFLRQADLPMPSGVRLLALIGAGCVVYGTTIAIIAPETFRQLKSMTAATLSPGAKTTANA